MSDPSAPTCSDDGEALPPRVARLHRELAETIPCGANVRDRLTAMSLLDLLGIYTNWAQRMIPPRKRQIEFAPGFWEPALARKHGGRVLALAPKIERGLDLSRHLSGKVGSSGYVPEDPHSQRRGPEWGDKDFALNAWNVHHLHLDEADPKGRHQRTEDGELLYAIFGPQHATFVLLGDHNSFDDGSLEEAVLRLRAEIGDYTLRGLVGSARSFTPEQRKTLARRGYTTSADFDGQVILSAQLSTAGTNLWSRRHADMIFDALLHLDPQLDDPAFTLQRGDGRPWAPPTDPAFEWKMVYNTLFLVEQKVSIAFPIVRDPGGVPGARHLNRRGSAFRRLLCDTRDVLRPHGRAAAGTTGMDRGRRVEVEGVGSSVSYSRCKAWETSTIRSYVVLKSMPFNLAIISRLLVY
jgi:hypothetical protein